MMNWEVGCTNTESKSICNVIDVLDNTVSINVAVLPSIVLGMVLASLHSSRCDMDRSSCIGNWSSCLNDRSRVDNRGRSRVGDGDNRPAWRCFHNSGGRGVVCVVLGVGQVRVLDLRGDDITSMVGGQ